MNRAYKELYLKFEEQGYHKASRALKVAYSLQREDMNKLIGSLARLLFKYKVEEDRLQLTASQLKNLNEQFESMVTDIVRGEHILEKSTIQELLPVITSEKYNKVAYLLGAGINFKMNILSKSKIKDIVYTKVDQKLWSSRLWRNKQALHKNLTKTIKNFMLGNTNVSNIEKDVKKRFASNAYDTKRLVETEVARCQSEANQIFAEEHNIDEVMYVATLDKRTCEICERDDGRIFKLLDPNKPSLPRHPLDRCCYVSVPFDDWKPTVRKAGNEYIPYMTYGEWKNKILGQQVEG